MKHLCLAVLCVFLAACVRQPAESGPPAPSSGLNKQFFDEAVRPQDDLYRYINGKWIDTVAIPADRARYGAFHELAESAENQLRGIIDELARDSVQPNTDAQKIQDLYKSFMDESSFEALGVKPLEAEFAGIAALQNAKEIPVLLARLAAAGASVPYVPYVHQDNRDSTKYVVDLYQAGLGLPDRDYYLLDGDDGAYKKVREAYVGHVEKMLAFADDKQAAQHAQQILKLETALAKAQWDKVTNRDPIKTYNKYSLQDLRTVIPDYDWQGYLQAADVADKVDYLLISQPSYLTAFGQLLKSQPLDTWKNYLKWRLLSDYAPYLSKAIVAENFAFYGTTLRGIPENRPRWKRGIELVQSSIGEGLGKLYVAKHFPAENKQRMELLVKNLLTAYERSIDTLDWMSADTKQEAKAKLARFTNKIGYPNKWRDYSALSFTSKDLVGNVIRAQRFEYQRNVDKLGKPIDRDEWLMTPQTVNAYYNTEMNEIVFPAAILQPPFFDAKADDAVNYGGIGAIIGHEISHGFDDQGSRYDGNGNLRDWWTQEDHAKFSEKTKALIAQYAGYEAVPGYRVNGELTLGENIADNSGLAIAYKAYQLSLGGKPAPVIDGLTGDQRFFAGWAQAWREKVREKEAIRLATVDPHSPARFRSLGAMVNQAPFYQAYDVKPGDKMYLPPEQRVSIW